MYFPRKEMKILSTLFGTYLLFLFKLSIRLQSFSWIKEMCEKQLHYKEENTNEASWIFHENSPRRNYILGIIQCWCLRILQQSDWNKFLNSDDYKYFIFPKTYWSKYNYKLCLIWKIQWKHRKLIIVPGRS